MLKPEGRFVVHTAPNAWYDKYAYPVVRRFRTLLGQGERYPSNPRGYFDLRMPFPAGGSVRLAWTYPAHDPLLSPGLVDPPENAAVYSRTVKVSARMVTLSRRTTSAGSDRPSWS